MRLDASRAIFGGALMAVLLVAGSAIAVGQTQDCATGLRAAPVEMVDAPPGWGWLTMEIGPDGWEGVAQWTGGDIRGALISLTCVDDAAGLLGRRAAVREAFYLESLELESVVGDEAQAWRAGSQGAIHFEWTRGDVFGTIEGQWNASLLELALMAERIDAVVR